MIAVTLPPYLTPTTSGLLVKVRAKPNARTESVAAITLSDGTDILEVRINAPAEDGKANKAICEALSKILKIRKSAISVKHGTTSRQKTIEILCALDAIPRIISILCPNKKPS